MSTLDSKGNGRKPLLGLTIGAVVCAMFVASIVPAAGQPSEPALPTDAEINRFIDIENALFGDPARAAQACEAFASGEESEEGEEVQSFEELGRKLDAHPVFGPVIRQHQLTGQRFGEISLQVMGALVGLGFADTLDAAAREKGQPATNRATLLAQSPITARIAPRQADLAAPFAKYEAACGENGDGDDADDESSDDSDSGDSEL